MPCPGFQILHWAQSGFGTEPANHVGVGSNGDCGGLCGVQSKAHPLQKWYAGIAIAVDLDEGLGGAPVAGGVEDDRWRKSEMDSIALKVNGS